MADILYNIPGLERSLVKIGNEDKLGSVFFTYKLAGQLINKFNTSVAYFSLNGCEEDVQKLLLDCGVTYRFYPVRQNNPDIEVILRKCSAMYGRRFVRAIIIDGLAQLRIKGFKGTREVEKREIEKKLRRLSEGLSIPIILLCPNEDLDGPIGNKIDVFEADIISQLHF